MNDREARHGLPATTDHLAPILPPAPVATPLQTWVTALLDLLGDARCELGRRELETFLDIGLIRITHDLVALGLDEWRQAA